MTKHDGKARRRHTTAAPQSTPSPKQARFADQASTKHEEREFIDSPATSSSDSEDIQDELSDDSKRSSTRVFKEPKSQFLLHPTSHSTMSFEDPFKKLPDLDVTKISPRASTKSSIKKNIKEKEEQEKFKGDIDDSESDLILVPSYTKQNLLNITPDFFDTLGALPPIEAIPEDSSEDDHEEEVQRRRQVEGEGKGEECEEEEEGEGEECEGEGEDGPLEEQMIMPMESDLAQYTQLSDESEVTFNEYDEAYDELLAIDFVEEDRRILEDIDQLPAFESIVVKLEDEPKHVFDIEAHIRTLILKAYKKESEKFLSEIIEKAVNDAEDPFKNIRRSLNKAAVINELEQKICELEVEHKACIYLNRRTADYFVKKKEFNPLMEDNERTVDMESGRLKKALGKLDKMIAIEMDVKAKTEAKIQALQIEEHKKTVQANNALAELEALMKKSIENCKSKPISEKLEEMVNASLKHMSSVRSQISEVRCRLRQRLSDVERIKDQIEKIEDIGNNITMRSYGALDTQTTELSKKVHERNVELKRLRAAYHFNLHIMSHMKEKELTMRGNISMLRNTMYQLMEERNDLTKHVFELKMRRHKLQREYKRLVFRGGLVDKPALMMDYEETYRNIAILKESLVELREKFAKIKENIMAMEGKMELKSPGLKLASQVKLITRIKHSRRAHVQKNLNEAENLIIKGVPIPTTPSARI